MNADAQEFRHDHSRATNLTRIAREMQPPKMQRAAPDIESGAFVTIS